MTVWVDDMYKSPMGRFGRMKMSHLIGDDEAELHRIAQAAGVARKWYQGDHYDVSISAREKAIALGAIPVTMRDLGQIYRRLRAAKVAAILANTSPTTYRSK